MDLTWPVRLRIIAAMAIGVVLLGVVAGSLVKPADPLGAITLSSDAISLVDVFICLALAFIAGVLAFFASYPLGCYIAPLAAPAGLCALVLTSGDMFNLIILNNTIEQRKAMYSTLMYEGFLWLAIVAAGYVGVQAAAAISKITPPELPGKMEADPKGSNIVSSITAAIVTVIVAWIAIGVLAQDVKLHDRELGSVVGQPGVGQIAFAVTISFGLAAFLVKHFLDVRYTVPAITSAILVFVSVKFYSGKPDVLEHMMATFPPAFFPRSGCAILPVQMVSFAAIGSVLGYWIAIKVQYHQKHG